MCQRRGGGQRLYQGSQLIIKLGEMKNDWIEGHLPDQAVIGRQVEIADMVCR